MEPGPVREQPARCAGSPPTAPTGQAPPATPAPATSASPHPRASTAHPRPTDPRRPPYQRCRRREPAPHRPACGRPPTPAIPPRPRPARPGSGRPPPAARRHDGEQRARAVPAARQPTASRPPRRTTTRQATTPTEPPTPMPDQRKRRHSSSERQQRLRPRERAPDVREAIMPSPENLQASAFRRLPTSHPARCGGPGPPEQEAPARPCVPLRRLRTLAPEAAMPTLAEAEGLLEGAERGRHSAQQGTESPPPGPAPHAPLTRRIYSRCVWVRMALAAGVFLLAVGGAAAGERARPRLYASGARHGARRDRGGDRDCARLVAPQPSRSCSGSRRCSRAARSARRAPARRRARGAVSRR